MNKKFGGVDCAIMKQTVVSEFAANGLAKMRFNEF